MFLCSGITEGTIIDIIGSETRDCIILVVKWVNNRNEVTIEHMNFNGLSHERYEWYLSNYKVGECIIRKSEYYHLK